MQDEIYTPPMPEDRYDAERVEHSRLRYRLLSGAWKQDLEQVLAREIGSVRLRAWGPDPDLTKNVFRNVVSQLSVLYDSEPVITHEEPGAAEELQKIISGGGLWQFAPRLQQITVGLREGFYRLAVVGGEDPVLSIRVVSPDMVLATPDIDEPDRPVEITEFRLRMVGDDYEWTRDALSIKGDPYFRVLSGDGSEDLSERFLGVRGGLVGDDYPYYCEGKPCLPYTLYHAERNSHLFSPYFGFELVQGSLITAVLWTFWRNCVKSASWPQRYAVGVRPAGGLVTDNAQNMAYIPTDPASLLNFEPSSDIAPVLGQFQPGSDPIALGEAIRAYAADLSMDFGISETDLARLGGSPRSGYAISLSREGVRNAQRRAEPQFRRGDLETLSKIAAFWNRATGSTLPETGWQINYPGAPLSSEEKVQAVEEWKSLSELGVASPVDLYMMIHNVSRDTATRELERIALERSRFNNRGV
jgi:hypothetical protein